MNFQLIGVNHKTAPVEVRERLAIPESRLPEALKRLAEHPGVDEGIILSHLQSGGIAGPDEERRGRPARLSARVLSSGSRRLEPHLYEYPRERCHPPPVSRDLEPGLRWWWASRRFWDR